MTGYAKMLFCGALACAAPLAIAATVARPTIIDLPGQTGPILAPDGSGARISYRPHMTPDGAQASPVFYSDGHGYERQVATITRSMGVSWSPDGKRVFLQDNWGSNVSDCYVLNRSATGIAGLSLSKLIQKTPGHPTGAEQPDAAHYYVHCDSWQSPGRIAGSVRGHTDSEPVREFDHPFVYDVATRRIHWIK